ncbi:MAG: tRNA (guanine(46)-N(7))-methyltransferase TrmB [Bdellovibrionia bacterium]
MRKFNPDFLKVPREPKYDEVTEKWKQYQEMHLEIGAGAGLHPIQFAKAHSDILLIGVERTREKYESFEGRIRSHSLSNLIGVHADVVPWLYFLPHEFLFDKIWILYPNPEPGNKSQRWINAPFFSHLLERLKLGGYIEMATNIKDYAEEVEKNAEANWGLNCTLSRYQGVGRTHFERKYLERGEACYSMVLTRK